MFWLHCLYCNMWCESNWRYRSVRVDLHIPTISLSHHPLASLGDSVRCMSNWWSGGHRFDPRWHSFMKIDHEIFSTICWFKKWKGSCHFLVKECALSGERMCSSTRLEDSICSGKVWLGKLTTFDMTLMGWLGSKTSTQTKKKIFR